MSDDLVKRLREIQGQAGLFASAAADRIEALVEERDEAKRLMQVRHREMLAADDLMRKHQRRAEAAEAEVEKLREVERAARKLEENLGVEGVNVGSLRVDLYRAIAALTQKEPTDGE